jgi:16S rRNA (cytosine1407-C5)-methyltransferase
MIRARTGVIGGVNLPPAFFFIIKNSIFVIVKNGIKNTELDTYLGELLGDERIPFLRSEPEPPAIRINYLKTSRKNFLDCLKRLGQSYRAIPDSPDGLILDQDSLPLSHTLAYFKGDFQYQGIASQLPVSLLGVQPGEKVLDMAASPGSKSAQLCGLMQQKGMLVLNDSSTSRMKPLNANMQKTGAVNHCTLKLRGERLGALYPEYFDKVLIDAPCTALGTMTENHEVQRWWRYTKLEKLIHIQEQLIISGLKSLRPGGEMVYATCSVAPEENELIVDRLLGKYPVSVLQPPDHLTSRYDRGITTYKQQPLRGDLGCAVRVFPHRHRMEGFFAIRLRKEDSVRKNSGKTGNFRKTAGAGDRDISAVLDALSSKWGIEGDIWYRYRYLMTKTRLWITAPQLEEIPGNQLVSAGLLLAEKRISGWKLVNGSVQFLKDHIKSRRIEMEKEELIRLFSDLVLPYKGDREDYYILTHGNEPLASVYSNGAELRLRSSHRFRLIL